MMGGLALTGCHGAGGSSVLNRTDAGTPGAAPIQLTAFASDLITNHTADDTFPASTEDQTFATDSQDPAAFAPSFFK